MFRPIPTSATLLSIELVLAFSTAISEPPAEKFQVPLSTLQTLRPGNSGPIGAIRRSDRYSFDAAAEAGGQHSGRASTAKKFRFGSNIAAFNL